MDIKVTRDTTNNYTLFSDGDAVAKTLLRDHVRAIDDSEDDLIKIYLDTAIDYMQQLSNRLLGVHQVDVYLDKDESNSPVTIHGIQDIVSVGALYYLAEDPDNATPFAVTYKVMGEDAIDTGVSYTFGTDTGFGVGQEYTIATDSHGYAWTRIYNVSIIDTTYGGSNVDDVLFTPEAQGSDGVYAYSNVKTTTGGSPTPLSVSANGTSASHALGTLPAGKYRIVAQPRTSGFAITGSPLYHYFNIHNGRDFDNQIVTDTYPMYIDIRKGADNLSDGAEYNRDFWKLNLEAGTALNLLPAQYKQAALLLVGHYYNMREAESIGGITTEVKEGVHRLIQSVRNF